MRSRFSDTCPECGQTVDDKAMRRAQVPWANRREIGRCRAIWQTFCRVTFRTRRFAHAVSQPVDLREALRFRRLVVIVLWLPVMVALLLVSDGWLKELLPWRLEQQIGTLWRIAGVVFVCGLLWVFLYTCTGVHTYWFHPRSLPIERQNRAVALSYYACAPLLMLPVALASIAAGVILLEIGEQHIEAYFHLAGLICLLILGIVPALVSLLGFWAATVRLAGDVADRGGIGRLTLLLGQPAAWVFLLALLCVALPAAIAYATLMLTTMN